MELINNINVEKVRELAVSSRASEKRFNFRAMTFGYAFFTLADYLFDYLLYPYIIYQRGLFWGGIVMALLSVAACLSAALFYDLIKKDWLGIEAIKQFKNDIEKYSNSQKSLIHRIVAWILKKGRWVEFLFLSLKFDPFVTTVYLRNGVKKFNGFRKEEWMIFISSVFISNAYWTFLSFSGVEIIKAMF